MKVVKFALLPVVALVAAACVQVTASSPVRMTKGQVSQIEAMARERLVDPNSAMFRNIRAADLTLSDGTTQRRFCGELNAKNRMGGYNGFNSFAGKITTAGPEIMYMDGVTDSLAADSCRSM